ncbi:hypothetical protein [Streptomyces sp. NPDC051665]|uniref:hypothetical protein n=1 Tax=Streptomyces sp. NPDC051665 TaxID=3154647 RepID=UPI003430F1AE
MAVTDQLPYPRYLATSVGAFEGVIIGLNIDDSIDTLAPGLTAELVKAIHGTIAARPEFTGAHVTRVDVIQTDLTPAT